MRWFALLTIASCGCQPASTRLDPTDPSFEVIMWEVAVYTADQDIYRAVGRDRPDFIGEHRPKEPKVCSASYSWIVDHAGVDANDDPANIDLRLFSRDPVGLDSVVELGVRWMNGTSISEQRPYAWSLSNGTLTVTTWEPRERIATINGASLCDENSANCEPIVGKIHRRRGPAGIGVTSLPLAAWAKISASELDRAALAKRTSAGPADG